MGWDQEVYSSHGGGGKGTKKLSNGLEIGKLFVNGQVVNSSAFEGIWSLAPTQEAENSHRQYINE